MYWTCPFMTTACRQQVTVSLGLAQLLGAQLRFKEAFQTEGHSSVLSNKQIPIENQYTNPKELHMAQWQLRHLTSRNRMPCDSIPWRQSSTQLGIYLRMLCSRQEFYNHLHHKAPSSLPPLLPKVLVTFHMNIRAKGSADKVLIWKTLFLLNYKYWLPHV